MAQTNGKMMRIEIANCPDCSYKILFNQTIFLGQIVFCPDCHGRFEVCDLNPVELDWANDDYEDEYDDDYEEWA